MITRTVSSPVRSDPLLQCDPSYRTLISKFKPGDLVFGLRDMREKALTELERFGYRGCFANALNNRTVTAVLNKTPDGLGLLQGKHYDFLQKHRNYLLRPNGKPIDALKYKGNQRSVAYRRACKLLLVEDDNARTRVVHVLTENLDWQRICSKTWVDSTGATQMDDSVTSSEMRAAYRYFRDNGKNHPHIIFYDAEGKVMDTLPWQQPALIPLFREYDRIHLAKIDAENALTQSQSQDMDEIETSIPISIRP